MTYNHKVPLLEHVANISESLSKSELKVSELVLAKPRFVSQSTMAAVAAACSVSEPTVMRFCTSLGFEGFQQFKFALIESLALGLPSALSSISPTDDIATITKKVFDHTLSSIDRARRFLSVSEIEAAVDLIQSSSSMLLLGHGASAIIANDAEQKSALLGLPCSAPSDPHQQFMLASMANSSTVVLAISNTGETRSVIEIVNVAKRNQAKIIALTGNRSTLSRLSDVVLMTKTFEDTDLYTPAVSRLAGLVIVDVLSAVLSLRQGDEHLQRINEMKEGLSAYRRE